MKTKTLFILPCILCFGTELFTAPYVHAQGRGGRGAAQPPQTAQAAAPVDLTGYWVAQITGDWRFRMVTPPKGDFTALPLNAQARTIANAWDPAKDESAGEQCKRYGAPALMRIPGRLHITWQDDQTMKLEMDPGRRLASFHSARRQARVANGKAYRGPHGSSFQGRSRKRWPYAAKPNMEWDRSRW
jgi:hypothetical protein